MKLIQGAVNIGLLDSTATDRPQKFNGEHEPISVLPSSKFLLCPQVGPILIEPCRLFRNDAAQDRELSIAS